MTTKAEVFMAMKKLNREDAKKARRAFWLRFFDTGIVKTDQPRQVWVNNKLKADGF